MTTQPSWIEEITLEEMEVDPYPVYARLRTEAPVAFIPAFDAWFVTRRDDIVAARRMHEIGVAKNAESIGRAVGQPNILQSDGEEHRDLRSGIDPPLLPKAVPTYVEGMVRPIAKEIVDTLPDSGEIDLLEALETISGLSLAKLLGLDVDASTMRRWFHGLGAGAGNVTMNPELFEISDRVLDEVKEIVDPLLAKFEHEPSSGLLSHMIHSGREQGCPRTRNLIYPSILIAIAGGAQEPGHLAASTVSGLLTRPEQMERVLKDASLVQQGINEGLRWQPPFTIVDRGANQDFTFHGREISEGSVIELAIGSANRDEKHFDNPEIYDLDRQGPPHLSFGYGPHICAGRNFGSEVARMALEELFFRYTSITGVEGKPVQTRGFLSRAPKTLHVTLSGQ